LTFRALRPLSLAAATVSTLFSAATASADELGTFGWDPETAANAGANVASGASLGALHGNPALMTDVEDRVSFGYLVIAPRLQARLMPKPPASDVPRSVYGSTVATNPGLIDRPLPTAELPVSRGDTVVTSSANRVSVGFASGFGVDGFKVGAIVALPAGGDNAANIQTHYDDEREGAFSNRLFFTRFGQWNPITSLITGAGVRVLPWLSAGLSVQLAAAATARLNVYVPDAAVQDHVESNMQASVSTSWRPVVGLLAKIPGTRFAIGASLRGESAFRVDAASAVQLWDDHTAGASTTTPRRTVQEIPIVFGWEPMELTVGAAWDSACVSLRASATFERWSHWVDEHGVSPTDAAAIAGKTIDTAAYAFKDVVSLAASLSLRPRPWLESIVGVRWSPSPIPAQVGRTSYVDGDLLALAFGENAKIRIFGRRFTVGVALQLWRMLPRTTYKDPTQQVDQMPDDTRTLKDGQPMPEAAGLQTNSPGYPGWRSDGWLLASSITLGHQW
jgi:long-chain fatty acid transport protein